MEQLCFAKVDVTTDYFKNFIDKTDIEGDDYGPRVNCGDFLTRTSKKISRDETFVGDQFLDPGERRNA